MEWIIYDPKKVFLNTPQDEESDRYFIVLVNGVDSVAKWKVDKSCVYPTNRYWDVPEELAKITHFCKRPKLPEE